MAGYAGRRRPSECGTIVPLAPGTHRLRSDSKLCPKFRRAWARWLKTQAGLIIPEILQKPTKTTKIRPLRFLSFLLLDSGRLLWNPGRLWCGRVCAATLLRQSLDAIET